MLKRFMNCLLYRLQKVLGAISRKRGKSYSDTSSQTNFSSEINRSEGQQLSPQDTYSAASEIAVDSNLEGSPFIVEDAPFIDEGSPFIKAAEPLDKNSDASLVEGPVGAVAEEPDTHRRFNIASAALPGVVPTTLSFPTQVSELIATSPIESTDTRQRIEQLPEIHDLLPAVETDESEDIAASKGLSKPVASDPVTVAPQAVLFSFDITESETESSDEPVSSQPLISLADEASDNAILEEPPLLLGPDAQSSSTNEINPLSSPVPLAVLAETLQPAEATKQPEVQSAQESVDTKSERVPNSISEDAPSAVSSIAETLLITPIEPNENSTKNGIVKLIFTLKPGNFHGYIEPDDGTQDILFHQKYINANVFDRLERGVKVVVSVKYIEDKAYAKRVDLR